MGVTVIFVEGETRETNLIYNLVRVFFSGKKSKLEIIPISTAGNLYMLWNVLNEDGFDTDLVEIVKERIPTAGEKLKNYNRQDIDEIYLFFDYDPQQMNLPNGVDPQIVIGDMLNTFDNETEHGKLYINYPMVEAYRDFVKKSCQPFTSCVLSCDEVHRSYKTLTGSSSNPYASISCLDYNVWKSIIEVFMLRILCLFQKDDIDYETYKREVSPLAIWRTQLKEYISKGNVFVLSAFPEFLLDYFPERFFKTHVKLKKPSFEFCFKNSN